MSADPIRYPIGPFVDPRVLSPGQRTEAIEAIRAVPERLRAVVSGLSEARLDAPYRPGGWTVRQVVHHFPDSHLNGYIRFKKACTEERPRISTYDQDAWAVLADTKGPIEVSLTLVDALHERWVRFLNAQTPEVWSRTLEHPETGSMSLDGLLALYAWHGRHHVEHIASLRERSGW